MENLSSIFEFWKDLTPSQAAFLENSARSETFTPGMLIHRSSGDCKGVMAVISGGLRVYCVSEEGREVTLYRVESGDVCILSASCLMDSLVFDVVIESLCQTKVCLLPSPALHKIEEENPLVSLYIYKTPPKNFPKSYGQFNNFCL